MPDTLTASFCERCGARHDFRAASGLGPLRRTRGFVAGLRNYLVGQDALSEALRQGIRAEQNALAAAQLDAFHESVHLCIDCRQYTCVDCWNDAAGRCRSCAPVAGLDDLAERIAANATGASAETNGGMAADGRAGASAADANGRPYSPNAAPELEWPDVAIARDAGAHAAESWPAFDLTEETATPTADPPGANYPLALWPEDEAIAAESDTDALEPVSSDAGGWWVDAAPPAAQAEELLAEESAYATLAEQPADEPSIVAPHADAPRPAPLRVVAWDEDQPTAATDDGARDDAVAAVAADSAAVAPDSAAVAAQSAADALAARLEASLRAAREAASAADAAATSATQPAEEQLTAAHDDPDAWLRAAAEPPPGGAADTGRHAMASGEEPASEMVLAEAAAAESEAAPEPVSAEAAGQPAMDDWEPVDAAAHQAAPDAPTSDGGAAEPAPDAPAAPVAPRVPPVRITRLRQTILPFPGRATAPAGREDRAAASIEDTEVAAARRAQLENLGLGDPGQGPVAAEGSVLPYRSRGAAPSPAHTERRGASVWEASAREVAGGTGPITVHTCGGCGLALSASARFCRRCGSPQARSA